MYQKGVDATTSVLSELPKVELRHCMMLDPIWSRVRILGPFKRCARKINLTCLQWLLVYQCWPGGQPESIIYCSSGRVITLSGTICIGSYSCYVLTKRSCNTFDVSVSKCYVCLIVNDMSIMTSTYHMEKTRLANCSVKEGELSISVKLCMRFY